MASELCQNIWFPGCSHKKQFVHFHRATRDSKSGVDHMFFCRYGVQVTSKCVWKRWRWSLCWYFTKLTKYIWLKFEFPHEYGQHWNCKSFRGPVQNISIFVSIARPHRRKSIHQYANVLKTHVFLRVPCGIHAYLGAKPRHTNKTVATHTQKQWKHACVLRVPCRI